MNKWMISAAVTAALPVSLAAQNTGAAFQYIFTTGDGPVTVTAASGGQTLDRKAITGRPLSAVEQHYSLQVLSDGTRIEKTTSDKFYRDNQGRTRTEREDGTILINDPVSGASVEVSGNNNMVRRNRAVIVPDGDSTRRVTASVTALSSDIDAQLQKVKAEAAARRAEQTNVENLGFQSVNGVSAQGTRTTTTIPVGQIGNDRPIQMVIERWVSPELQMLIKSSNKDPRFGETTYELTNITQGAPDPALFQIPASSHP